jgi:hypothetical protein
MPAPNSKALLPALIAGYVALVALVIWGMSSWRQIVVPNLSTPEARAAWDQARNELSQEDGSHGPVQHVAPKSPEPPMLVLLRDYFVACVFGLLAPLSALYAFIAWIACGLLQQSSEETPRQQNTAANKRK